MAQVLSDVNIGDTVQINGFNAEGVEHQMVAHGMLIGSDVRVVSKLPFNGAIACECQSAKFAIRAEDAAQVIIHP
jgi:Fe2+ transport system protein FeoA